MIVSLYKLVISGSNAVGAQRVICINDWFTLRMRRRPKYCDSLTHFRENQLKCETFELLLDLFLHLLQKV